MPNSGRVRDGMVSFERVGLRYGLGPEILRDISFSLAPGSLHFLTGASGAGKSSLLSLLYLARKPSRGTVKLFGEDVTAIARRDLPPLRRQIGVVFQDFRLLDHLPVIDNVALPLRVQGIADAQVREHAAELLAWVGLGDHLNALPPTLSGGQKQRVAIARAVIGRPRLLIADEPTGNVDDRIAVRLMRLFDELNRLGTTIVIATHNMQLVQESRHPELRLDGGALYQTRKGAA